MLRPPPSMSKSRSFKAAAFAGTAFVTLWVTYAVVCLALSIGCVYVAIHFITKFW